MHTYVKHWMFEALLPTAIVPLVLACRANGMEPRHARMFKRIGWVLNTVARCWWGRRRQVLLITRRAALGDWVQAVMDPALNFTRHHVASGQLLCSSLLPCTARSAGRLHQDRKRTHSTANGVQVS
jgi:hypothetical protein